MPNPNNRRLLAKSMAMPLPMTDEEELKAYQAWPHFGGMFSQQTQQQSPSILGAFSPSPTAIAAQAGPPPQGSNPISDLAMKLIMLGWNPEKEFDPRKRRPSPR